MKKMLSLVAVLMIAVVSFGQNGVSFTDATSSYNKTATISYNIVFGAAYKAEDIKSNATYYESYFTVTVTPASAGGNTVNIKLVEDNEMARRVILRLLVNMDIKTVNVNGTEIDRNDFMTKYIMVD
jgi:hypothetical protein